MATVSEPEPCFCQHTAAPRGAAGLSRTGDRRKTRFVVGRVFAAVGIDSSRRRLLRIGQSRLVAVATGEIGLGLSLYRQSQRAQVSGWTALASTSGIFGPGGERSVNPRTVRKLHGHVVVAPLSLRVPVRAGDLPLGASSLRQRHGLRPGEHQRVCIVRTGNVPLLHLVLALDHELILQV